VKAILKDFGVTNCVELDWWQSHSVFSPTTGANIEVVFTPTKHWTARSPFDRNTCLWGSFAVRSPQSSFFFTGDTAYCPVFKQIGSAFGPFDFAAIPIGAYAPRWFMQDVHCNPEEAVRIHQDLRAKRSLAVHWGTFPMADEDFIEPALELARARDVQNVSPEAFFTMKHGETVLLGESSQHDFAVCNSELYGEYLEGLRGGASTALAAASAGAATAAHTGAHAGGVSSEIGRAHV
jgi:N-acyl-phosphatidylethanolamine-hydrolysing phospholipase D